MLFIASCIGVFFAAAVLDYATASYFACVGKGFRYKAGCWSVVMGGISALGAISMFKISLWLIIPELAGLFVGTVFAVPRNPGSNTNNVRGV